MKYLYCIIASIPLITYILNFTNYKISDDPEKWAFFGDYIGGVYSVVLTCILTYLMYQLNKKDEQIKEKKIFAKSLLHTINEFNKSSSNLDVDKVDSFRNQIIDNEFLFRNESDFSRLINIADYYLTLCSDINQRNPEKDIQIKSFLKDIYNGK